MFNLLQSAVNKCSCLLRMHAKATSFKQSILVVLRFTIVFFCPNILMSEQHSFRVTDGPTYQKKCDPAHEISQLAGRQITTHLFHELTGGGGGGEGQLVIFFILLHNIHIHKYY